VFLAASLALILTSGLGTLVGGFFSQYMNPKYLSYAAGTGFIVIGLWTFMKA